ncbi:beta-1,3-galactosyltransferase 5 isoform X3 [Magallana gigas]|uniref:beta-1,3-galactosyltransferase 5 isoform X3 n=2 Tax=Magallana gigas TaxID=29159 RepID=UPI003340FABE
MQVMKKSFNSCFRNLSAGNIRVQLVVLNSLCLVLMVFALMYTNNVHRTPPSHSQPYECKEDFGYGKASLEEIISGTAQQLDHPNFTYIRNANKTCIPNSDVILLILVKSAVGHFRKRQYIRETWGKDARKRGFKIAFLLGFSKFEDAIVGIENGLHEDLIQQNFEDSYVNNTHKIKMALSWISEYCKQAKYILIVDDDMYVNIPNTISFILQEAVSPDEDFYSGHLIPEPYPDRCLKSKHFISKTQYPFACYPPYIAGGSILLNKYTVEQFVRVMQFIPYLPFDDVFLGFIAQKLGIEPTNNAYISLEERTTNANDIKNFISQHGYNTNILFRIAYNNTHMQMKTVIKLV